MSLRDAIELFYTDEDGLILESPNIDPGANTGNGLFNLAVYTHLLLERYEMNVELQQKIFKVAISCQVPGYPGLFYRGPRKTGETIAHDDYVGLASMGWVLNIPIRKDIVLYGEAHGYSFNSLVPNQSRWSPEYWKLWHGRHGLIPFYRACAGYPSSMVDQAVLCAWILANAKSDHAGGKILTWLKIKALAGRFAWIDWATSIWWGKLKEQYVFGMKDVFATYYGTEHPFTRYAD